MLMKWIVVIENDPRNPTYQVTKADAEVCADERARRNPGKKVYIFAGVDCVMASTPIEHIAWPIVLNEDEEEDDDDDIC